MFMNTATRLILAVAAVCLAELGASSAFRFEMGSAQEISRGSLRSDPTALSGQRDAEASSASLDERLATQVRPFLERYCFSCHDSKKHKGSLDLSRDATAQAIAANFPQWPQALERLHAEE